MDRLILYKNGSKQPYIVMGKKNKTIRVPIRNYDFLIQVLLLFSLLLSFYDDVGLYIVFTQNFYCLLLIICLSFCLAYFIYFLVSFIIFIYSKHCMLEIINIIFSHRFQYFFYFQRGFLIGDEENTIRGKYCALEIYKGIYALDKKAGMT